MDKKITACERCENALFNEFWDESRSFFQPVTPTDPEHNPCYWWQAHAIDTLVDRYLRTGEKEILTLAGRELEGTVRNNGGTILNNWYDDMEWMALALLRLYKVSGEQKYLDTVLTLWEDIKTAWNDNCCGGMAWRKNQLDYKNTPANAPAAILALRLYREFGRDDDFEWGKKILEWNRDNLMDPVTHYVYDGMNREGDGKIDYAWTFTYNHGVMIGAAVEMYKITKEEAWKDLSSNIAWFAMMRFAGDDAVLNAEGSGDCGLFRGILVRYLAEFFEIATEYDRWAIAFRFRKNAAVIAENGMAENGLVSNEWRKAPEAGQTVDLAQHLSALMLLEMNEKING